MKHILTVLLLLAANGAIAQADRPGSGSGPGTDPLVIGVFERPPYATQTRDGAWLGLAVDLWRLAAEGEGWRYELRGIAPEDAAGALTGDRVDAVLAVDATPDSETRMDFSHPLHTATMGVATQQRSTLMSVVAGFLTWRFLQLVLGISVVLLAVGALIWVLERRRNEEQFSRSPLRGLGDGFWWAGVTLTTIGYGDKAPVTLSGRVVAMLWMLTGLAISAALTAAIVNLTDLSESIEVPERFHERTVGVVDGSTSASFLEAEGVALRRFASVAEALRAMQQDEVDTVAAARPVLQATVSESGAFDTKVQRTDFDPHYVSIALPEGSVLREPINRALLARLTSESGWNLVSRYLPE
ncbi:ion channel [Limimaricola sp.]|uniref:ion channel n=1 Tax=Limimaricola sp. TaxID=2211665 RepID=UPI004057D04F